MRLKILTNKVGNFDLNKAYCIDCLDGLKKIPDKSVDLAFIDPPYNVGKDYGAYKDNLNDRDYMEMISSVIDEFSRVTRRGFGIYIDWKQFKRYWQLVPEAEPIIIFKRSSGVIYSPLKIVQHHHIILTTAKAIKPKLKSLWDDIRVLGEGYFFKEERFGHPAQTSLKATKRYIEYFTEEDDIILDCFTGVGTTAAAALSLNRKFIGFDLNPEYVEVSNTRIKQNQIQEKITLDSYT